MFLYDLRRNHKEEILTKYRKIAVGDIFDCEYQSNKIYFHSYEKDGDHLVIFLHRYDYYTDTVETIYHYVEDFSLFPHQVKIQFFVLNDSHLLIQKAHLRSNLSESYHDYLDFEQTLYHIKEKREVRVIDENFANNGIAYIEAISPTEIMIKTGFSLIEDKRYEKLEPFEMSVESIGIANTARIVSDLYLTQNNLIITMIEQAFQTKTFANYYVKAPYLVYSTVNFESYEETVVFYNYETREVVCSYINHDITDATMLAKTHVIAGSPYIQLDSEDGVDLYELLEPQNSIHIPQEEKLIGSFDDYILIETSKKALLGGKEQKRVRIQKIPEDVLHTEKGTYIGALADKDNLYLFVQ